MGYGIKAKTRALKDKKVNGEKLELVFKIAGMHIEVGRTTYLGRYSTLCQALEASAGANYLLGIQAFEVYKEGGEVARKI
jgi:hypothetical protein|tara:strand:- start:1863 stop:2102 length:240 start_codon:yes stop_codon:yes gene_type:complete